MAFLFCLPIRIQEESCNRNSFLLSSNAKKPTEMDSYAGLLLQYIPGFSLVEGAVQNIMINVLKTGMLLLWQNVLPSSI